MRHGAPVAVAPAHAGPDDAITAPRLPVVRLTAKQRRKMNESLREVLAGRHVRDGAYDPDGSRFRVIVAFDRMPRRDRVRLGLTDLIDSTTAVVDVSAARLKRLADHPAVHRLQLDMHLHAL